MSGYNSKPIPPKITSAYDDGYRRGLVDGILYSVLFALVVVVVALSIILFSGP